MEQIRMDSVWVSVKTCGKSLAMRRSTGCYQYFQGTFSENFLGELMKVSKQWWLWVKPVVAFLHRAFYSTIQQFAVAGGKPLAHWPTSSYCFLITVKVMAVLFQLALLTRIPNNHPLPQDWIRRRKSNATFFFLFHLQVMFSVVFFGYEFLGGEDVRDNGLHLLGWRETVAKSRGYIVSIAFIQFCL